MRSPAGQFEDLFTKILSAEFPDSFHVARAGGREGDLKCDGWDSLTKTNYAVYGPFAKVNRGGLRRKIRSDFLGARENWPEMRRWRFVHNDSFGLKARVTRALEDLRADVGSQGVEILSAWGPDDLWRILANLSEHDRREILGGPDWAAVLTGTPFSNSRLWKHDELPVGVVRSAINTVAHLCGNFQPGDEAVDPVTSWAMASALASWWLDDRTLWTNFMSVLFDRSDSARFEMELTASTFTLRALQFHSRRVGKSTSDAFDYIQLWYREEPEKFAVLMRLRRLFYDKVPIVFDDPIERRVFVATCLEIITDTIGTLANRGFPAIFSLEAILGSLQRLGYSGPHYF